MLLQNAYFGTMHTNVNLRGAHCVGWPASSEGERREKDKDSESDELAPIPKLSEHLLPAAMGKTNEKMLKRLTKVSNKRKSKNDEVRQPVIYRASQIYSLLSFRQVRGA
jgi:hypothetical protein